MTDLIKIWLLTTNCSGKTTFVQQEYYHDILLLDTDTEFRGRCSGWPVPHDAITLLNSKNTSSCLMTSMVDINIPFENLDNIQTGIVCIPLQKLIEHLHTRKKQHPNYTNETEESLTSYWSKLYSYAQEQQLPIYESFMSAIDIIGDNYDKQANL